MNIIITQNGVRMRLRNAVVHIISYALWYTIIIIMRQYPCLGKCVPGTLKVFKLTPSRVIALIL